MTRDDITLRQLAGRERGPALQTGYVDESAIARLKAAGLVTVTGNRMTLTAAGRARLSALQAGEATSPPAPVAGGGKLPRIYT